MKNNWILPLIIICSGLACSKNRTSGFVEGTVLFRGSKAPIAAAEVKISEGKGASPDKIINTTHTNQQGYFQVRFQKNPEKNHNQFLKITFDSLEYDSEITSKNQKFYVEL